MNDLFNVQSSFIFIIAALLLGAKYKFHEGFQVKLQLKFIFFIAKMALRGLVASVGV